MKSKKIEQYQCPVCNEIYETRKEAEKCAAPIKPKYKRGQWVILNQTVDMPNPAFDDWFGGEDPYDRIIRGTIAKITKVSNENGRYRRKKPHPDYVYHFSEAPFPLNTHAINERYLNVVQKSDLEELAKKQTDVSQQAKDLVSLIDQIKEDFES